MNKKIATVFVLFFSVLFVSCISTLQDIAGDFLNSGSASSAKTYTNAEAITATKDALEEGIKAASSALSKENAYYKNEAIKILLPSEAEPILEVLSVIPGGSSLAEDVILRLNRTAEEAAKDTVSIFVTAIKSMTVSDGIKIVTGNKNAATEYLKEKCYDSLVNLYKPKVSSVLNKPLILNISANTAWTNLVTSYNKYASVPNYVARLAGKKEPFPAVEVDLAKYATEKALDGLFVKIAEEESKIRENPLQYASAMIQKVFSYVKKGMNPVI